MTVLKRLQLVSRPSLVNTWNITRRRHLHTDIYFGTTSLNRHSFLRADPQFIAQAITSPYAKIIFFDNSAPIVDTESSTFVSLDYSTIGSENRSIIDTWVKHNEQKSNSLSSSPVIHFLGLESTRFSPFKYKEYTGTPYFALEVSRHPTLSTRAYSATPTSKSLPTREEVNKYLSYRDANIFAHGKMYLEWLSTTRHCRGCGSITIPINAGSELRCTSSPEKNCPIKTAKVSNASFPRLDPVLITCVLNPSRTHVLLTRNPHFPKGMYTHIAGFIEPGETIEEAVKREVWEESGLLVDDIKIVRSQPWPYPTNIMIGCVAVVSGDGNGTLNLEHDLELEDAFWCELDTMKRLVKEGELDENLTLLVPGVEYGIPNDTTLANKLFEYVAENY
ncbi:NADH pyrophosphatase [Cyberlindnera fabianii]|uniref:NAD(+) diphosphatase n=1 Tax=Cyberlindnera fabianii TaxID=36022 RepID=A0A1V2L744_CYBFA|nr:NADH pyrophosphatase [Cyberlindnera fabianii]